MAWLRSPTSSFKTTVVPAAAALTTLAIASSFLSAPSVHAENPCVQFLPLDVQEVQGDTWIGDVTDVHHGHANGSTTVRITFHVTEVLADGAGAPLGARSALTLSSGPCNVLDGFAAGDRYLVSTASADQPGSQNTAAWQLIGDDAAFVIMHPNRRYDPRLAAAHTVDAALALVAPGTQLPPTSTTLMAGPPPLTPITPTWLVGVIGLSGLLSTLLWRRSGLRRQNRPSNGLE